MITSESILLKYTLQCESGSGLVREHMREPVLCYLAPSDLELVVGVGLYEACSFLFVHCGRVEERSKQRGW